MSTPTTPLLQAADYKLAEHKLADMATTIEFTMVSLVAGLMLFPWIDYATPLIREMRFEFWVYVGTMLALVMLLWTSFTTHTFTFVGWPIDIGHNLLYLLAFPIVGIVTHFMSDPQTFYPTFVLIPALGGLTALYDLMVIRRRRAESGGAAAELYAAVYSRQLDFVYMTIGGFLIAGVMAASISALPEVLLGQHIHVVFGFGLLGYIIFMLGRELRGLNRMRNKILAKKAEEIAGDRGAPGFVPQQMR